MIWLFFGLAFSQFCGLLTLSLAASVPTGRPSRRARVALAGCGAVGFAAATVAMLLVALHPHLAAR